MSSIVTTFAEISDRYDVAFVDLWGCMHNGITPFQESTSWAKPRAMTTSSNL